MDARIRIVENIEKLEEYKFVEEKTDEDIARERRNQLVKTRNEEALRLKNEWEDKRRGAPSKRARPTDNDQDEECDAMDTEDNLETRGEIDDDSMDIDDNNHDYAQAQQTPDGAGSNAGNDNE